MHPYIKACCNTRFVVSICTLISVCYLQTVESVFFIFGAILNALFSKLLKDFFNHTRPQGSVLSDPGMPSSHAQTLFYYCCLLFMEVTWYEELYAVNETPYSTTLRVCVLVGFCFFAAASATWRVIQGYHTFPQVFVGALLGILFGIWYRLWCFNRVIRPLYRIIGPPSLALRITLLVGMLLTAAIVVERSLQKKVLKLHKKVEKLSEKILRSSKLL